MCDRPFVLSDGLVLPVGTRIGFPAKAIQRAGDNEFDGFRHTRKNEQRDSSALENNRRSVATAMATNNLA